MPGCSAKRAKPAEPCRRRGPRSPRPRAAAGRARPRIMIIILLIIMIIIIIINIISSSSNLLFLIINTFDLIICYNAMILLVITHTLKLMIDNEGEAPAAPETVEEPYKKKSKELATSNRESKET